MTCKQIESDGVIEQYVANKLTNAARKQFEIHYFECDLCFQTLEAYQAVGVDTFILSGMPLLEEAYRFGELVLPRLPVEREVREVKPFTWSTLFDRDLDAKRG